MSKTKTNDVIDMRKRLAAVLADKVAPAVSILDDDRTIEQITGDRDAGAPAARHMVPPVAAEADRKRAAAKRALDKGEELTPVQIGDLHRVTEDLTAHHVEVARFEGRESGKAATSASRMAAMRRRQERRAEFDAATEVEVKQVDPARLMVSWQIVEHLAPLVAQAAREKRQHAERLLGSVTEDVAQVVLETCALTLAKSGKDLSLYLVAAGEITKPHKPSDSDDRKRRKEIKRARKWLRGMAFSRVTYTLRDLYRSGDNVRARNIDILDTVLNTVNGHDADPMTASFRAAQATCFMGYSFTSPGAVDRDVLAHALMAAITDRGLDTLVDLLLDDENRRSDGTVAWSRIAKEVFLASPETDGEWAWEVVKRATKGSTHSKKLRGVAARNHCRSQFEWLKTFTGQVVEALDPEVVAWSVKDHTGSRAIVASPFQEGYLKPSQPDAVRQPLAPALDFASTKQAAEAIEQAIVDILGF